MRPRGKKSKGWLGINNPFNGQPVLGVGWRQQTKARTTRMPKTVAMPSTIGLQLPTATFNVVGRPQANADFDTTRGLRMSGSGLANFTVTNASQGAGVPISYAGLLDYADNTVWYIPVVPGNIDPRLYQICKCFQFYAFRSLTLTYVPTVGTDRQNNVALGISQDPEEYLQIPTPTQQQILEFNTSTTTPAWQTTTLEYKHPGTKTWFTNYGGAESGPAAQFFQAQIAAAFNAPTVVGGNRTTGTIFVTYVIDLYEPQPVEDVFSGAVLNPPDGYIGRRPRICDEEEKELYERFCQKFRTELALDSAPQSPPLLERTKSCHFGEMSDIEDLPSCLDARAH
jgi:hypothetical protein